jgi:hypothetical protein
MVWTFSTWRFFHLDPTLSAEPPPSSISQLTVKSRSSLSEVQRLQEAHLRLGHPSFESLIQMSKNNLLLNLPSIRKHHPVLCNECFRHNRTHVPRNPRDKSTPPLFSKIGCDFTFYSNLSLRGHNSAFTCVDHTSRYPFAFPTCAKRPPIAIIQFFVGCLQNMGFKPVVFKMDEGGELCKSTEFCKALTKMNLIIQSTGGVNKTSIDRVEVFHSTLHHMNRSTLATMRLFLPDPLPKDINLQSFWDLSLGYVVQLKRILFHSSLGDSPYHTVFKRRPSYKDYHQIVQENHNKLISTSRSGFFVGKGNNTLSGLVSLEPL